MKKTVRAYILGFVSAALLVSGVTYASSKVVRIVIDGQELIPTDVNGKRVDPILKDGTTYLPVRAISNAIGKAVYWDGPNYTVYLGDMDGELEYPTVSINDVTNIANEIKNVDSGNLTDNYGNAYTTAIRPRRNYGSTATFQSLLNMKYSTFKATIYVPEGCTGGSTKILIKADGKTIWSSPEMTKTSRPVNVDVNIMGCNDFQIEFSGEYQKLGYIADAGFYQ